MALHPKVIDLTLDRMWRLLENLGNPQNDLPPVIHIAGTNGKGSTQAMIRAGLEAAGKKVHAYTSPHLARFHERIRLAGALIDEEHLTEILDECYGKNGGETITYFEITTAAAILAMARTPADYTLLEVGLGGRLDATNVIGQPLLSIITPISIDHEQFLGNTLTKIAGEKAGIIKRRCPVIVAPQPEEAMDVIEATAERHHAQIIAQGQHWQIDTERDGLMFQDETGVVQLPRPNLPGDHQIENAGTAVAALRHLGFNDEVCEAAVSQAHWPARMQKLNTGPIIDSAPHSEIWLDGGHNPAAGQAIGHHLGTLAKRATYLICGMLNTKDISGYLNPIAPHVEKLIAVSIPGEMNTLTAADTAAAARGAGMQAETADDVLSATQEIVKNDPNARILICGSLYLAGNILRNHA
ncbi:folylpolyglutamate synthase/dihydrofolate synthase [Rhodobacteraceae bacterium HIMB11]|nr:folylpolyglutamate synthase/dihydrofolate synthase [Rhodobacteraceae bacterium HIMB11]